MDCSCRVAYQKSAFNFDKCMVVNSYKQAKLINCMQLTKCTKYQGASIDSKLSFNQHVNNVCKKLKANSVLSPIALVRLKKICILLTSNLLSCCSINKLESVQRYAAHFVMNDYCQTNSVTNMLSHLN